MQRSTIFRIVLLGLAGLAVQYARAWLGVELPSPLRPPACCLLDAAGIIETISRSSGKLSHTI
jgi:hypothetical protein